MVLVDFLGAAGALIPSETSARCSSVNTTDLIDRIPKLNTGSVDKTLLSER